MNLALTIGLWILAGLVFWLIFVRLGLRFVNRRGEKRALPRHSAASPPRAPEQSPPFGPPHVPGRAARDRALR